LYCVLASLGISVVSSLLATSSMKLIHPSMVCILENFCSQWHSI
jgi:hypothetical protein